MCERCDEEWANPQTCDHGIPLEVQCADCPEQLESRTYKCFCGDELVIEFGETDNWDDRQSGALAEAGWVVRGTEYRCPVHAEDEL